LEERWVFDVSDEEAGAPSPTPRRDRFLLLKPGERPGPRQIPMELALDRVQLNKWIREEAELPDTEVARADSLRDRFREYSVPVASLVTESLDQATESFQRINSGGTPMSPFHMVTALAYTDSFDPQAEFARVRGELLEPEGWGNISDMDMLRVCAGLLRGGLGKTSQHPTRLDIRGLATDLKENPEIILRAGHGLKAGVSFLRSIGVHGPAILPYSWQLLILAIEAGRGDPVAFSPQATEALTRWFWLTTYGGVFAGINAAVVDRATQALSDMLTGGGWEAMRRDTTQQIEEATRFDFRAARSRACVLQMANRADQGAPDGPAHTALASGAASVGTLEPKLGRSKWFNLVIESRVGRLVELRKALRDRAAVSSGGQQGLLPSDSRQETLLNGIGIEVDDRGAVKALLECRRSRLLQKERAFVEGLGLSWRGPPLTSGS